MNTGLEESIDRISKNNATTLDVELITFIKKYLHFSQDSRGNLLSVEAFDDIPLIPRPKKVFKDINELLSSKTRFLYKGIPIYKTDKGELRYSQTGNSLALETDMLDLDNWK